MANETDKEIRIKRQLRAANDSLYGALLTLQNFDHINLDQVIKDFTLPTLSSMSNLKFIKHSKENKTAYLTLSNIVLVSFAIEIYTKLFLFQFDGTIVKTHDLKKLFKKALQKDQKLIEEIFIQTPNDSSSYSLFLYFLNLHKDIFDKFRYYYEVDNVIAINGFLFGIAARFYVYYQEAFPHLQTDFSK